jgi:hypothetical protein
MLLFMKKHLALAAALVAAAGAGTGCSGNKKADGPGSAKVNVSVSSAAQIVDVTRIELTISEGVVSATNPAMNAITATLTKAPQANQWTGNVTNIPAGAARVFKAEAFDATSAKVYEGATTAAVVAASTAQITIILQELNVPPGSTNYAPVITSITSTDAYVKPSTDLTFAVAAVDLDHNGEPLAYLWSASCNAGTGTFTAGGTAPTATFKAPDQNATCTIAIKVSETGIALPLSVTTYSPSPSTTTSATRTSPVPQQRPIISSAATSVTTPRRRRPDRAGGDLFFSATDPDGDNVRYDLATVCGGTRDPSVTPGLPVPAGRDLHDRVLAGRRSAGQLHVVLEPDLPRLRGSVRRLHVHARRPRPLHGRQLRRAGHRGRASERGGQGHHDRRRRRHELHDRHPERRGLLEAEPRAAHRPRGRADGSVAAHHRPAEHGLQPACRGG